MLKKLQKIIGLIAILLGMILSTSCQQRINTSFCLIYKNPQFEEKELIAVSNKNLLILADNKDNYRDICE